MLYKKFVKKFFLFSIFIILFLLILNLSVDPYNKYGINLWNIDYKLTRDDRGLKIGQVNQLEKIDNLILGSSRSQTLDPKIVSKFISGVTYNFGVGGGTIEDSLGMLLYLEKERKLPKNILLCLDFSAFNSNNKVHSGFVNSKELNFIKTKVNSFDIAHFLSIDTTRSSIKTLKMYLNGKKPKYYFNKYGLIVSSNKIIIDESEIEERKIKILADKYFQMQYSNGEFILDKKRLEYYKQFISIVKKYNINLKVLLTPIYSYQLSLIKNNNKLNDKLNQFLVDIKEIYPFYNFINNPRYNDKKSYFADSVHYKKVYGDIILSKIYGTRE